MLLLEQLRHEMEIGYKNGLYHLTQIKMAYNSNRIEGSRLTEEQTVLMYETKSILCNTGDSILVNDIVETQNHFILFNYMLETAEDKLSEALVKEYHRILKSSTVDSQNSWFRVGEYKKVANMVGLVDTAKPDEVPGRMKNLIDWYNSLKNVTIQDIIKFHYEFESIHPFQDGNGRVGRIIMFKECLKNGIIPFIIEDTNKAYYYRGLREYTKEPGYLIDTCLYEQDIYNEYYNKFIIA